VNERDSLRPELGVGEDERDDLPALDVAFEVGGSAVSASGGERLARDRSSGSDPAGAVNAEVVVGGIAEGSGAGVVALGSDGARSGHGLERERLTVGRGIAATEAAEPVRKLAADSGVIAERLASGVAAVLAGAAEDVLLPAPPDLLPALGALPLRCPVAPLYGLLTPRGGDLFPEGQLLVHRR